MNFLKQIALGNHLTKLTNVFEEIENTRASMPIGSGGGVDSLPTARQAKVVSELEERMKALSSHPRHVITRELVKNMIISRQFGRGLRLSAQERLMKVLVSNDIALTADEFNRSYS